MGRLGTGTHCWQDEIFLGKISLENQMISLTKINYLIFTFVSEFVVCFLQYCLIIPHSSPRPFLLTAKRI